MKEQEILKDYKKQEDKMCLAQVLDKIEFVKTKGKIEYTDAQIQILRKRRFQLLDEIHSKQQSLDELDYMIGKLKKGEG